MFATALLYCWHLSAQAANPSATGFGSTVKEQASILIGKARQEGPQRVIVGLDAAFRPAGRLSPQQAQIQRQRISGLQSALWAALAGTGAEEHRRFRQLPFIALVVDATALQRLASFPEVVSLQEDLAESPFMASSIPVVGADTAWTEGYDGSGWTVAVLDSGVDRAHPYFANDAKVVSEACYSTNGADSVSLCPGNVTVSTAMDSGRDCPAEIPGCDHGTHVAGSAAGNDHLGPNYGVGRGAGLIAIQVFSRFDKVKNCGAGNAPCILSYISDQVAALERVFELRNNYQIAAVNMSLGGGSYTDEQSCDNADPARKLAIDNLRSVGIATVVASGNGSRTNQVSTPACISTAISVGATTDSDAVAGFSNVADFLDLLAPGVSITSSVPGGGIETWNGTSMATPHVAGAWAVLKQASPGAGVARVLAALRDTGTLVDDQRSGGSVTGMRRINVDLALEALRLPAPAFESEPQPGSLINFGPVSPGLTSAIRSIEIGNPGEADLQLSCLVGGEGADVFTIEVCPDAIPAGMSSVVELVCRPLEQHEFTAALNLVTNDPQNPNPEFALVCSGGPDSMFRNGFEAPEAGINGINPQSRF